MPFVDVQGRLGINVDRWLLLQSGEQPNKRAARCHAFEKEWVECSHGIGRTRAMKECHLEFEDFYECMYREKTHLSLLLYLPQHARLHAIRQQRDKLVKEGKYTPPACHTGKATEAP
ncbi:hypothetical protein L3Q82_003139 [Scortum barcoo]|uniref:Uncharacterized protein n=1 Tax=Scortum barcoo TaxID=214431 RepID=A0ACB8VSD4_9TELE|nr:hypothetical protein L3Q82_003139 [Scortum barcoo]